MAIKLAKKIKRTNTEVEMTPIVPEKEEKATKNQKEVGNLPPDDYKDEIKPLELELNETNKLVFSVKRGGDYGLPHVDIRHYVMTERFTGFTKKGITFPLEYLLELADMLQQVSDECDRKGLE